MQGVGRPTLAELCLQLADFQYVWRARSCSNSSGGSAQAAAPLVGKAQEDFTTAPVPVIAPTGMLRK